MITVILDPILASDRVRLLEEKNKRKKNKPGKTPVDYAAVNSSPKVSIRDEGDNIS